MRSFAEAEEETPKEEIKAEEIKVEEISSETAADEDLMGQTSAFKELTGSNVKEVMQNKENKFIYFYRKSDLGLEEFKKIEEFALKI